MKRFAAFIITALLAVTSVFAATGNASGSGPIVNSATAKTTVVLNLKAEDLSAYRIGFATDVTSNTTWTQTTTNMDDIPSEAQEIVITDDFQSDVSKIVSKTNYIFYKVRGTSSFKLTLSAENPLTNGSGKVIDYNVAVTGGTGSVQTGSNSSSWTDTVEMSASKPFAASSYPFQITTSEITAAQVGEFSSTLKLSIQSIG